MKDKIDVYLITGVAGFIGANLANKLLMNKKVLNIIDDFQDLDYRMEDNETLIINFYSGKAQNMNINVIQTNNTKLVINYSIINEDDTTININSEIIGNSNTTIVKLRAVASNHHTTINVCSKAKEDTKDNIIEEDLKAICEEGTACLMPILEIETNEVEATHYATVSNYSKEELFYLTSKGISELSAKEMIKRSFMFSLFSDSFLNMIERKDD